MVGACNLVEGLAVEAISKSIVLVGEHLLGSGRNCPSISTIQPRARIDINTGKATKDKVGCTDFN